MDRTINPTSALAPGWHLYPGADTCWRLAGPDGSFVRITGPQDMLAAVSRGRRVSGDEDLRGALITLGAIVAPARTASTPSARVHVAGDDPLARAATALLEPQDVQVVGGVVDEDAVAACDAVLLTAMHPQDIWWRQVDTWCRAHATALTTACTEGTALVLGPAGVPGRGPSYVDARGRRLAAAPLPDELAMLWKHLEKLPASAGFDTWPDQSACTVAAAVLIHDLLSAVRGQDPGRQVVLDPAGLTLTDHPVLALPRGIAAHP